MRLPTMATFALTSAILAAASPAAAQWTRVTEVPASRIFSVWANRDTIAAGGDSVAHVSTDAGATWRHSTKPVAGVVAIEAVRVRNGRLYAGTFGQGVHVSDDLGATWQAFNQGLVGGFLDSQLDVVDLVIRGDDLYAATAGAGVYERHLAGPGTWHPFGAEFEPNQASNVNALSVGGGRLLASAGSNGQMLRRDPGEADWTISNLDNLGVHAGLQAARAEWNGTGWVVGTAFGVFRSTGGQEPWSLTNPGLGPIVWTAFATLGRHLFAAFDIPNFCVIEDSGDDGATWQDAEVLPDVFVLQLAVNGNTLYAARRDGLWRRSVASVTAVPGLTTGTLRFALAGPQPFRSRAILRFDLPEAATATIEVFDVAGRATGERVERWWSAGSHEVSLDAGRLAPGVYTARLTAGGRHETARLVHLR